MDPEGGISILILVAAIANLSVNGFMAHIVFASLNYLNGWARDFLICIGIDCILLIIYIMAGFIVKYVGQDEACKKWIFRYCTVTFFFHTAMIIWATIVSVHSTDTSAKTYGITFVSCHVLLFVSFSCAAYILVHNKNRVSNEPAAPENNV